MKAKRSYSLSSPAFRFVLMMGIVNLFADMTYEGGGAINGQFLGTLGASAAVISIIAGLGEFVGYGLRAISGYIADKTGKYWLVTFVGYSINLLAVPALALVGDWKWAAGLILAERIGRAIRKPTVEGMLSYTTGKLGKGWVYGLNTALDETGATLGPLIVALALFWKGNYRFGYSLLLISSLLALTALASARIGFPVPSRLQEGRSTALAKGFSLPYWLYMLAGVFFAAGLMSYELVGFHLTKAGVVGENWIPVFLAMATGFGVVASLVLGKTYDRVGLPVVLVAVLLSSLFSPLVFFGNFPAVILGMCLLGVGYAIQDTLLKAIIADLLPEGKRSLAFGLFYAGYGTGWLGGSVAMGLLYEHSRLFLVIFAVATQLVSVPLFAFARRQRKRNSPGSGP
ncbi:MFS transporter [Candidatus Peregrinibacteria bacterium]|nr:MFS transporter [Candidatus Peregrinibacteria bacterium]